LRVKAIAIGRGTLAAVQDRDQPDPRKGERHREQRRIVQLDGSRPLGEAKRRLPDCRREDHAQNRAGQAKEAADAARKAGATFALVSALSLVIGAFIASAAAALGGRQRDEEEAVFLTTR